MSRVESRTRFVRSLSGREDERAYRRLGPVTYHYIDETLAGLVLFYSLSLLHTPFDIMQFSKFISQMIVEKAGTKRKDRPNRFLNVQAREREKYFFFLKKKNIKFSYDDSNLSRYFYKYLT